MHTRPYEKRAPHPGSGASGEGRLPGVVAWRMGKRRRAAAHVSLAVLPASLPLVLRHRLLAAWSRPQADVALATLTLIGLAAAGWALGRSDAGRLLKFSAGEPRRAGGGMLRRLGASRVAVTGLGLVGLFVLAALLAPLLAPYDPIQFSDIGSTGYAAPSATHWLGTDQYGRDVLSRLLYGARVSLGIGFVAVGIAVGLGTLVGLVAGYRGGRVDGALMRFVDMLFAFPRLFLVVLVVGLLHPSIWLVIAVLGATGWMGTARLVRAQVLGIREADYVRAAVALGLPARRIAWRHVLPNALTPVVVSATLLVGQTILNESILSFLGLGVQVPTPSWGLMIKEGQAVFPDVWWLSAFPGLAITLTVVGYNLLGDAIRDALDVRLRT